MTWYDTVPSADVSPESAQVLRRLGDLLAGAIPDVRAGQMWRATWDGVTVTGIVLDADVADATVELAPFTVDVDYADAYTGIVPAVYNPVGVDLAVFSGLTAPLPAMTLDRCLGQVSASTLEALVALWRANLTGLTHKDSELATGTPDVDAADPRRDYRNTLRAQLAEIQMADLLADTAEGTTDIDLPERLLAAGLAPSDLVTDSVSLSYARQAAEGNAPVTRSLAERIAELLGEPDATVFETDGPALPPALAACLASPRAFSVVREIMQNEDLNEVAAARRIPAMVKFRRIDRQEGESEQQFWANALDMLRHTE